ncbi:sensor domain-containing diguanylate cyclase [Ectothiorhodospira marina]|uniref:diguanylate cyclase n=1 Tax=Ectothiorhodospira marina TaxID=1396821 RepID=A0A1H7F9D6_9GAMM|nr:diguanylate cyclase [Ectothiorhodospira marina]SEK22689.1 diguanylate cyclase (GGDEF) domain-containing protein [Ectothiorhodospira marina]
MIISRLQTKTMGALLVVMLAMMLVIGLSSMALIRDFSVRSATEHTRTAAEMIRVSLTEAMLNDTIDRRASMLRRLAQVNSLNEVRVIRGEQVIAQHGEGLPMESPSDDIDRQVLESGEPYFGLIGGLFGTEFRATIPYIASSNEDINCLACHQAPEGAALGAVTLTASVDHMKHAGIATALFLVVIMGLFAVLSMFFMGRLLRPLVKTTQEIRKAASLASGGDFSQRVRSRSRDEIGQIAVHFNQMADAITHKLTEIRDHVAQLVNTVPDPRANLLEETASTVSGLVKVAQFKQAIEEDQTTEEVFFRLSEVLRAEFGLAHFTIYQVDPDKRLMETVIVDGVLHDAIRWCHPDILEHCTTCRAVRTGHAIDGLENRNLCRAFDEEALADGRSYLCLPIIQSGGVGSVVQLVVAPQNIPALIRARPLISAYLREAAPVLQAKGLMASLRESSLKDAMTGLHNRRFLEEYSESLVAQCKRRQTPMTLMMLDLDYFKTVNDTHGHDVGDEILRELASIFQAHLRESDLVIRYGGEEFIIILLDTGAEAAMAVANKIRLAVEAHPFKVAGSDLHKTLSIGLAAYPDDAQAFWQVLKYADVALYAAKENGRNQVVRFTAEMWPSGGEY